MSPSSRQAQFSNIGNRSLLNSSFRFELSVFALVTLKNHNNWNYSQLSHGDHFVNNRFVLKGGGGGGGGLNPISQPFFRPNPSPSNEIKKKSQSRFFIVTSSFKTQFCVSLLLLELVLPGNRYKCLLFS